MSDLSDSPSPASPNYVLQRKRDTGLSRVDLHHHDSWEIFFLLSGDVTYTIEGRFFQVRPGDLLVISPRDLHRVGIRADRAPYERFVLQITPQAIAGLSSPETDLLSRLDPSAPGHRNQIHLPPARQRAFEDLLSALLEEESGEDFGRELMSRGLLTQTLVTLCRLVSSPAGEEEARKTVTERIIAEAADYIAAHYAEPITVDSLAERFLISRSHLSHEFPRLAGASVHQYLQKKRLQAARLLLLRGEKPGQVWEACGFGDYTSFFRAYKAEYGTPPGKTAPRQGRKQHPKGL